MLLAKSRHTAALNYVGGLSAKKEREKEYWVGIQQWLPETTGPPRTGLHLVIWHLEEEKSWLVSKVGSCKQPASVLKTSCHYRFTWIFPVTSSGDEDIFQLHRIHSLVI